MDLQRRRVAYAPWTLAVAVALALGGCSAEPPAAIQDACTSVDAWVSGGSDPQLFEQVVAEVRRRLADGGDNDRLLSLANNLADAPESQREDRAGRFLSLCRNLGWEAAEV